MLSFKALEPDTSETNVTYLSVTASPFRLLQAFSHCNNKKARNSSVKNYCGRRPLIMQLYTSAFSSDLLFYKRLSYRSYQSSSTQI